MSSDQMHYHCLCVKVERMIGKPSLMHTPCWQGLVPCSSHKHACRHGVTIRRHEGHSAHIDDGAAGLHVGHSLLREGDHAHNVHQERLLQPVAWDLCEVLHCLALYKRTSPLLMRPCFQSTRSVELATEPRAVIVQHIAM